MEIPIKDLPIEIKRISSAEFNVKATRKVQEEYKSVRQSVKAPVFALT